MSCGKLPRLLYVSIVDAPQLGQVFGWKQAEGQKLVLENVLPKLIAIRLVKLPNLHTICQGIDFHTVKIRRVRQCPAISLPSAYDGSIQEMDELLSQTLSNEDYYDYEEDICDWAYEVSDERESERAEASEVIEGDSIVSPKSPEIKEEESLEEDMKKDSTMPQQNNGSPNFEKSEEVSKEIGIRDSTTHKTKSNFPNLTEDTIASTSGIVEEKLSTTPSSSSDMNLKATFGEGPSFEKYDKESSSAYSKPKTEEPYTLAPSEELCGKEPMGDQQAPGENKTSNEPPQRVEEPIKEFSSKETSNEMVSSIPSPKKPQIATSASHVEMESGISAITDHTAQDKTTEKPETSAGKQIKFDQGNQKQFAEDDLMRLFRIMDEGAEMEVHIPDVSKIAALRDDNELKKALTDLEASLKMSLSEITCSEESKLRLENALNILSSHCSEEGAPSHGLQATIHSLQQEIQTVLSSSKQAYASIDTFNELERKEKLITEEASKRKEAATTLLSKIHNKESSLAEAQQKEAELKEKISKIQAEVYRKEKEIQECEIELLSLKEQKKKSVFETMGLINQFDAVKRERYHMEEENIKAKQQLQNMDVKWSSCLSNLRKVTLLLGVHLQHKLS
ncbi:protein IWS1 homolog [Neltuma alba]|uniref:protein IWS1 homolog n=1 Tax=Neltuma alba TaxID=207710 RepID=UPI0010A2F627|nr:protein IWS1 homolog [Prosopis alba]